MRSSVLSRSIIVLASLTIGSAALTAAPAGAATPSGISRETVLAAANAMHEAYPPSTPGLKAVLAVMNRGCHVNVDDGDYVDASSIFAIPMTAGGSADGFVGIATIHNGFGSNPRDCLLGVIAASSPDRLLNGAATLTTTTGGTTSTLTTPLSGDVTATAPVFAPVSSFTQPLSFSASGAATRTTTVKTSKKVKDKKTASEKQKAKKTYAKRLASAKKDYRRALRKAGSSKIKRTAAKRTYSAARKSAKARFRYAVADYRIVTRTARQTDTSPFAIALAAP